MPSARALLFLCAVPISLPFSPQALSILMLPHNIPSSLSLITSMVDDMWHYAGDQSTDVSAFCKPTGYQEELGLSVSWGSL